VKLFPCLRGGGGCPGWGGGWEEGLPWRIDHFWYKISRARVAGIGWEGAINIKSKKITPQAIVYLSKYSKQGIMVPLPAAPTPCLVTPLVWKDIK